MKFYIELFFMKFQLIYIFMKFEIYLINKTALYIACEKEEIEIVKLLLSCNKTDANLLCI